MNTTQWKTRLESGGFDRELAALCGGSPDRQRQRRCRLIDNYVNRFGDDRVLLLSAPGRTELAGNHTDHQHHVLCVVDSGASHADLTED